MTQFLYLVAYRPKVVATDDGLIVSVSKNTADNTFLSILRNTDRIPIKASKDCSLIFTAVIGSFEINA